MYDNNLCEQATESTVGGWIYARFHQRFLRRLDALNAATAPEDMNLPGFDFQALRGHCRARYTVHVNGPSGSAMAMRTHSTLSNITGR
ncbi:MAG: hypothetical protein OXI81_13610 [Paracoccaceae bacterium]|nr:hypothetical protein [Paracoccaceae bacterium]